jgi:hypothetical protein
MDAAFIFFGIVFVIWLLFGGNRGWNDAIEMRRQRDHEAVDKSYDRDLR